MDTDENARAHAHLKEILLQQIESQEKGQVILKKIFRRISIIYISISAVMIIGIMFLIYIISRPESRANTAMKEVDALNTRISLQRQYIEIDRKELESQKVELLQIRKTQDSIKK